MQGYCIEPAIFTDTKPNASIYKDEIFGPVVVINKFKTEEEMLQRSNDSKYELMAGVFTQDINRALRIAPDSIPVLSASTASAKSTFRVPSEARRRVGWDAKWENTHSGPKLKRRQS